VQASWNIPSPDNFLQETTEVLESGELLSDTKYLPEKLICSVLGSITIFGYARMWCFSAKDAVEAQDASTSGNFVTKGV